MKRKNILKQIIAVFLCFTFIIFPIQNVHAEKPSVEIRNGILTFSTIDTKATSNIRWKTVGFTVTRYDSGGNPIQDKDGDGNPKNDYAQLWLADGEKKEVDISGGKVQVTFTISEEKINEAFSKNKLDEIQDNDTIYLSGIFQVLHGTEEQPGYIYTLNDIKSAEDWVDKKDFEDHFDIPVVYNTTYTYPITIERWEYHTTGNTRYDVTKYDEQKKNTTFTTDSSKIQTSIQDGSDTYFLYRVYYVNLRKPSEKLGNRKTEINPYYYESQYNSELDYLRNRDYTVKDKGLKIVALYRRFSQTDPSSGEDTREREFEEIDPTAVIQADSRGNEAFDVTEGIPGTESLYANVITSKYLSSYVFTRKYGTKIYPVNVKKTYHLTWTTEHTEYDENGQPISTTTEHHSQDVPINRTYMINREYSYWEITSLAVYGLDHAVVNNAALPGGTVTLTPNGYTSPTVNYTHGEDESDHITEPKIKTVTIPTQTISGGSSEPSVPTEDFTSDAEDSVDKILCKNDKLVFNGQTIMSEEEKVEETDDPEELPDGLEEIGENVLYKSGLVIPGAMANGEYETTGTVTYKPVVNLNLSTETNYIIQDINPVVVHTPTVCDAKIQDNYQDNQMLSPDRSMASLVLDRPFKVIIPTIGNHRYIPGYGYNDYGKYIATRQVKFPFDVYTGTSTGGTFVPAGHWVILSNEDAQFYLPTWVPEGQYTVQYRSLAINASANNGTDKTQTLANTSLENYVATDTTQVEISGRIYGLNLYDISDYPMWENVFRSTGSLNLSGFKYTVGTKDQNGDNNNQNSKYTLALVNGSHPNYSNIGAIKTGYVTRFSLKTVGTMNGEKDYIRIKPTFYYVDSTGKNRQEVDLYYSETINGKKKIMVKMGSDLDLTNKKALRTGDPYLAIPEGALKQTAYYQNVPLKNWKAQMKNVFTFTNIMLPGSLRTFVGYVANVPAGVTEQKIAESVQNWYGEYYLPSEIHVVPKGFDILEYVKNNGGLNYKEPFWLKDGYVIVNFQIETVQNGTLHLSYINADNAKSGYCNMWKREGYQNKKVDYKGNEFNFTDGDYVLYYTDKSAAQDYITGGTH